MPWVFLSAAIVAELLGTIGLRAVANDPVWWAYVLIGLAYTASFGFMAVALRHLNVGVVYAIWAAVGTAAIAIAGFAFFDERISWQGIAGMVIIVSGVIVLVSSGTVHHT
ncbi:MAG: small multidrug resistance pump [Mycobacterium sp.]|nr:small multidrug resistance pump [Mycobacterium sp.]